MANQRRLPKFDSRVARVRRYATDNGLNTLKGAEMTDRDYRHLLHACDRSPRRAIQVLKQGEKDVASYIKTWRDSVDEAAEAAAPIAKSTPKPVPARDPAHGDKPARGKTVPQAVTGKPAPTTTVRRVRRVPATGGGLAAFAAAAQA